MRPSTGARNHLERRGGTNSKGCWCLSDVGREGFSISSRWPESFQGALKPSPSENTSRVSIAPPPMPHPGQHERLQCALQPPPESTWNVEEALSTRRSRKPDQRLRRSLQQPTLPREHRQRNSSRRLLWTPHRHHRKEKKDQKTDHPKPPLEPSVLIRLSPTPTICSVSPWTAGKGRRRRIEEAIRLILDCSENRTGV